MGSDPVAGVIVGCSSVIPDGDRFVLVREAKESARRRYNLPAGKPELGETLIAAAVREAREECGLTVEIDHLVGVYHCPQTSEGFGVVNFVFAARATGGALTTSNAHPEVRWLTRDEIGDLARRFLIRGKHIERALADYAAGVRLPLSLVQLVEASPLPPPGRLSATET